MANARIQYRSNICSVKFLTFSLSVLYICCTESVSVEAPVVNLTTGLVVGKRVTLKNEYLKPVDQYLGIPYARAPEGNLRFRATSYPAQSWDGIKNTTTHGPVCPQVIPSVDTTAPRWSQKLAEDAKPFLERAMEEDCLYLNVYVPTNQISDGPFPVVVFIHGDSFDEGTGNMYDGSVLASHGDVIVVTFNYRLGILGFLSSGSSHSPGNYGLMDQVAALRWVHDNIAAFGGDAQQVTLMGAGTGGACAGLLMLSNKTRGLFSRVITQSGSPLSPWVMAKNSHGFFNMIQTEIGCQYSDPDVTMSCLRQKHFQDFLQLDIPTPLYSYSFSPVVDGDLIEEDPEKMLQDVQNGRRNIDTVAYLTGLTKNEGFHYIGGQVDSVGRIEADVFEQTLNGFVQNNFGSNMKASGVIKDTISYEYTNWATNDAYTMRVSLQNIITDHQWVSPAVRTLKQLDDAGVSSHFYLFTHRPKSSPYPRWAGPVHLEELPFVFGAPIVSNPLGIFKENYTNADAHISLALMTYWANFIKTGDPNLPSPQESRLIHRHFGITFEYDNAEPWPSHTNTHQQIMYLTFTPKVRDFYRVHQIALWEHLIPQLESRLATDETTVTIPSYLGRKIPTTTEPHAPSSTIGDVHLKTTPKPVVIYTSQTTDNGVEAKTEGYMIELSMVIAVGGFLLLLNLIILGFIYYLRDKKKIESRLAAKYLAHLEDLKKKKANGRGFMQTTPDSGIGFSTLLNAQNGKSSVLGVGSHPPSRDGTIRINEDGDIEFEV